MSHVSLEEAKSYSRIYFDDKDADVTLYLDAAEEYLAKFLNRESLSDPELLLNATDSPPPDSPSVGQLRPALKVCVLQQFDEIWQNHGIQVVGSSLAENPTWMRCAHLYRTNLGV